MKTKQIKIDPLSRVEGEGVLDVTLDQGKVLDITFKIIEPPRFFEALLRGRSFDEAHDITSRICGVCPIAYQMSTIHAMENALGIRLTGQLRELRRFMYAAEWVQSHALHIFMLHAPDFLRYPDSIKMAKDHPELIKNALALKKIANEMIAFIGGRSIHPINAKVGGFYHVPTKQESAAMLEKLKGARDIAYEAVRWSGTLPMPDFEQDYEFVTLHHPDEYPFNEGRLVSSRGLDITPAEYEAHFREEHVQHSTALQSVHIGHGSYLTGPLARYTLNYEQLSPLAKEAAHEAGLGKECRNPYQSIVVRCVELLYALDEAIRVLEAYEVPERPSVDVHVRPGTGYAITEAPRGILYNRYQIDDEGHILEAKIIPPTSQNQLIIQEDLWQCVEKNSKQPEEELLHQCELTIRNYDPCISCSAHFLKMNIKRIS